MNIFTPNNLVAHLYNETTEIENKVLEIKLQNNAILHQEFEAMQQVKNALDDDKGENPSTNSVDIILQYSKNNSVKI